MDKNWTKDYPSADGLIEANLDENTSLKKILRLVGSNKKVIDFGCATGYLASLLKQKGCSVTGVEINPEAAKVAEEHCERVIVADLDFVSITEIFKSEWFDVAIFGDVLEHLRNPWKVLGEAKSLLKTEGYIVASIPNIAHGSVRLSLLKGDFHYDEFGILDETHLRFFTRHSIQEMFQSTGYVINDWGTTQSDVFNGQWIPKVHREDFEPSIVNQVLAEETSDVLQFICKAMPIPLEERLRSTSSLLKEVLTDLDESASKLQSSKEELLETKDNLEQAHAQNKLALQRISSLTEEYNAIHQKSQRLEHLLKQKDSEFKQLQQHLEETFHNITAERQQYQQELEAQAQQYQQELEAQAQQYQQELEVQAQQYREVIETQRDESQSESDEIQRHLNDTFRNIEAERFQFHQQREDLRQGIGISISYFILKKFQRLLSKIIGKPINKETLKSAPDKLKHKLRLPAIKRKLLNIKTKVQDQVVSSPHEELLALSGITPQNFLEGVAPLSPPHKAASTEEPTISILTPTWNSSLDWFLETAISVLSQTYDRWEWCIVDDGSQHQELRDLLQRFAELHPQVKVLLGDSGGISAATNQAMAIANGEYICFLDHDDTLTPNALATLVAKLDEGFDVVYSDEDKIDFSGKRYVESFHKPDWSPEYCRGVMYVGHLLGVRKQLAESVGGVRSTFDGVQDYDLMLRLSEQTSKIGHIPQILYHWRKIPGSISGDVNAKSAKIERLHQDAVNEHLHRLGLPAQAEAMGFHRLKIVPKTKQTSHPLISIIIPTKDAPDYLDRCLKSLFNISSYPNIEVILVDNETTDERALQIMATHEASHKLKRVLLANPFNYSRANNVGVSASQGEYLVFLNNDTEVIAADWLESMLYYAEQEHVGAVGGLLLFPDRTVQHAGVVMGFRGTADHVMRDFPADGDGYAGSLCCAREVSAVTAACLMIKRSDFEKIGGFSEHFFTHYQDVDLCLKLVAAGKTNIFTPRAVLTHYESKTRKAYYDWGDRLLLLDQFQDYIEAGDRYYNPNFDLNKHDYSLRG